MRNWLKKIGNTFSKKKDSNLSNLKAKEEAPPIEKSNAQIKDVDPSIDASIPQKKEEEAPAAEAKPEAPPIEKSNAQIKDVDPLDNQLKEKKIYKKSWFDKLGENFKKTSSNIKNAIFLKKINESSLEEIEEAFLLSDLGVHYTQLLINELKNKKAQSADIKTDVANFLESQFADINHELIYGLEKKLKVILLFGVNGSGKTTTIAKLAKKAKDKNMKVLLAAADTFRAAATEQIQKWGEVIQVDVFAGDIGEDPSSVVFKAHKKAIEEKFDLLIIDTAGRLHNKIELMEELKKMTRIIKKNDESAPHNKILVLDSTIGQNTYNQIDSFNHSIGITGVIMTKLDGSAKGGSLIGITKKYNLPIHAIGIGEKIDDLIPFVAKDFVNAFLGINKGETK